MIRVSLHIHVRKRGTDCGTMLRNKAAPLPNVAPIISFHACLADSSMPRWILIVFFAMLSGIAAVLLAALAVGELLSGAAPTPVSTLSLSLGTDFPVEPVRVPRHDNSRDEDASVHAWLVRGEPGGGVILLVHSIRSNRVEMLSRARFLNEHGYGVLLIDLQAHGETPGERITFGVRESEDVQAAVNYLRNAFPR